MNTEVQRFGGLADKYINSAPLYLCVQFFNKLKFSRGATFILTIQEKISYPCHTHTGKGEMIYLS